MITRAIPPAYPRQRIGLFGGSFDPAHPGHAHVAETALKRLGLDRVWWLVTPQNPLKPKSGALETRLASARAMARGRKMRVTAFEAELGLRYTFETIAALQRRHPATRFVLIIGADSLTGFRHWKRWRAVMQQTPLAIVSRPLAGPRARFAKPAILHAQARLDPLAARALPTRRAPAWVFLNARFHPHASSRIREERAHR